MLRVLKAIGSLIKNFMIIFSFIVSLVLVIVLIVLGLLIFDIKHNVATPLVGGLHSSFVGLDESTIDWTIPVRDRIPVVLNIPLQTDTVVVLTAPVPLNVNATIDLPGLNANDVPATVSITLPQGLELPVALDLNVPVDEELDVSLDVRAIIPIAETQLHDPIDNLRLLFEPLTRALYNLPDDFNEAQALVTQVIETGQFPDLMAENDYSRDPWAGYSETAGLGYPLGSEPIPPGNEPLETGVVPLGGIPLLDELIRPDVYEQGGPTAVNTAAQQAMTERGIVPSYYNGDYAADIYAAQRAAVEGAQPQPENGAPPAEPPAADTGADTTSPQQSQLPLGSFPEQPAAPPVVDTAPPVPLSEGSDAPPEGAELGQGGGMLPDSTEPPPPSGDDLGIIAPPG